MLYNMYRVMLCYITYVMLYNTCDVMLDNMSCHVIHVMLYKMCHVMLCHITYVML